MKRIGYYHWPLTLDALVRDGPKPTQETRDKQVNTKIRLDKL